MHRDASSLAVSHALAATVPFVHALSTLHAGLLAASPVDVQMLAMLLVACALAMAKPVQSAAHAIEAQPSRARQASHAARDMAHLGRSTFK